MRSPRSVFTFTPSTNTGAAGDSPVPGNEMPMLACLLSPGPLTMQPITATFISSTPGCVTFHAGTTLKDGVLTTNGGRVLCVVGLADTVKAAQRAAYGAIEQIQFDGAQYRTDIGHRAIRH